MFHVASRLKPTAIIVGCASATLLVAAMIVVVAPREAAATPAYGQQMNMPCGGCHINPVGGGKLTTFGMKWQAGGHKLPGK